MADSAERENISPQRFLKTFEYDTEQLMFHVKIKLSNLAFAR